MRSRSCGTAEEALNRTDDFLSRGNIQSAYGRIARRQGKYDRAVECFERAIAEYRLAGGGQLQLARALQNLAFVQRLLASRGAQGTRPAGRVPPRRTGGRGRGLGSGARAAHADRRHPGAEPGTPGRGDGNLSRPTGITAASQESTSIAGFWLSMRATWNGQRSKAPRRSRMATRKPITS